MASRSGTMRGAAALGAVALLGACRGRQSILAPAGDDAERLADLFWIMLTGAVVLWLTVAAIFIYVTMVNPRKMSPRSAEALIIGGGIVLPTIILGLLLARSLPLMPAHRAQGDGLVVHLHGEQWWWRVRYETPEGMRVVSANEIRLPAGKRTEFRLTAERVIHSFWVPALGGKTDLIPGRETEMSLRPTEAGLYRGQCAEFCGASHALMGFETVVMEAEAFDDWLGAEAGPANPPETAAGRRGAAIFAREGCGACHAIRGTEAVGEVGPDLTHIGNRHSIGAGILPMTRAAMVDWIAHTARIKPEVEMPQYDHLAEEDLSDLAIYLLGLT